MKIEIKEPSILTGDLVIDVSKMEFLIDTIGIARFTIPYLEMDKVTIAGLHCPGIKSVVTVKGTLNDKPVKAVYAGKSITGVKHGRRGISFELDLKLFEFHWMPDEKPGEKTDGKECKDGVVAVASSDASIKDPV